MGVARPTARARLAKLRGEGMIFLLSSLGPGRPLLYHRDSYQGYWVRAIIERIRAINPDARFFWWKTGRVRRIGLVARFDGTSIGFQISENNPNKRVWWPLFIAYRRGLIQRGFYLHNEDRAFRIRRHIFGLPLHLFCDQVGAWIGPQGPTQEALDSMRLNNTLRALSLFSG